MSELSLSLLRSERRRLVLVALSYVVISLAFASTAEVRRAMAAFDATAGTAFAAVGGQTTPQGKALAGIFSRLPLRPGIVPANAIRQPAAPLGTAEPLVSQSAAVTPAPGDTTPPPGTGPAASLTLSAPPGDPTNTGPGPSDPGNPPILATDNNVPLPASVVPTTDPPPVSAVPEPASWLVMIMGMFAIGMMARRRSAQQSMVRAAH